jgi:UDP-N-acetylglucosamine 2-epimerase (hydrolysing)
MRSIQLCTSGRGDLHLLRWLQEELHTRDCAPTISDRVWGYCDIAVVLGDRYEAMNHAVEAIRNKKILVHAHGGEQSLGSMDNMFRNAITKLSHYHFPATELSRKRIIEMGEDPDRVMNVGSLGVERVNSLRRYPNKKDQIVFTWHPSTINDKTEHETDVVLSALAEIDAFIIAYMPNRDPENDIVRRKLYDFVMTRDNVYLVEDGGDGYIHEMESSCAVVGNSSAGIIEAPACGTMTVNIGSRQDGRERGGWYVDVRIDKNDIIGAINFCLEKRSIERKIHNPYDKPGTRKAISDFLLTCDLTFAK